jgi:hypothetical protein
MDSPQKLICSLYYILVIDLTYVIEAAWLDSGTPLAAAALGTPLARGACVPADMSR